MNKDERIKEYQELLSKETITPDQLLMAYDMITTDITLLSEKAEIEERMLAEIDELKTTNHKLFLRVTGDAPVQVEPQIQTPEDAISKFEKLIKEGKI